MKVKFQEGKDKVGNLVEYYRKSAGQYRAQSYKEAHARKDFIDPFFAALGWDVHNEQQLPPQNQEVVIEDSVDIEGHKKAPDYAFRFGRTRMFFVEAKKPGVAIKTNVDAAYQLRRYAWSSKLALSLLTDFEELAVYDCRKRPVKTDKASVARTSYYRYEDYPDRWQEIWDVFSRDAVWSGSFDAYAKDARRQRGTSEVDDEFLREIEEWRNVLARHIAINNKHLEGYELNDVVQRTIDRIIFLRIAEDRGMEEYGWLRRIGHGKDVYARFMELCHAADEKYNSGLFDFSKTGDEITPGITISDRVLRPILSKLYYPDSPYEFSVLPAEILGNVYEQFLGKVIRLTPSHRAVIEEKPEVKKAGGVYYTPSYIVDYIVENTVGKKVDGKGPTDLKGFLVLDMACGSGSFLLGAYQFLMDHYLAWYQTSQPKTRPDQVWQQGKHWRLTIGEKKRILTEHIFGVDIDRQAVEVTKLSLLLKVLEGENKETFGQQDLFGEPALPNLAENIKCGNSLIGWDYFDGKLGFDDDEVRRINPFDWEKEFPDALESGGFDCVIGNPPYVNIENIPVNQRKHLVVKFGENRKLGKRYDIYQVFALAGMKNLCKDGVLGYIVPNTFLMGFSYSVLRRRICSTSCIYQCVDLPQGVFRGVTVDNVLIFLQRESDAKKRFRNQISVLKLAPKSKKERVTSQDWDESFFLSQGSVSADSNCYLNLHANPEMLLLFDRVASASESLGTLTMSSQGIILYKTKNDSKEAKYTGRRKKRGWKKLLRGKNIGRYETKWEGEYVHYGPWLWCSRDDVFFASEKILLQALRNKSLSRRLIATLDEEQHYNAHNLANIISKSDSSYSLKYILGFFNSNLLNTWYKSHFPNVNINPSNFRQLPIRTINFSNPADVAQHDRMVKLVERMLNLHKKLRKAKVAADKNLYLRQIDGTDREIDNLVYELYGLTEEEIAIVEK